MAADKTSADCHVGPRAVHTSGKRDVKQIEWIVLHDTEGSPSEFPKPPKAEDIAGYFKNPKSGGSAHLTVDDNQCWRSLDNEDIAWGAPGANTNGFHIEQCGYAAWTPAEWKAHSATVRRAAYKAAFHCHKFGIPPRFVDAKGLIAHAKGITTHAEVSKAFPNNAGNHFDPGTNWPRAYFMAQVRLYYNQMKAK